MPVSLTRASLGPTLAKKGIVIIDFWADWCGPCKQFGPIFEAAAARHPDVTFAKIDTEAEGAISSALGIRSIPTVMVFRDGVPVFEHAGMLQPKALDELVRSAKALDMKELEKKLQARSS